MTKPPPLAGLFGPESFRSRDRLGISLGVPRSHSHDPSTSHRAEAELRDSGRLTAQQRIVLNMVTKSPGFSASWYTSWVRGNEIFSAHYYECRQQVRRRLSDLLHVHGLVRQESVPGQREVIWHPA